MMATLFLLIGLLCIVLYILVCFYDGEQMTEEQKELLAKLVQAGHTLNKDGVHLYKARLGYTLLYFDNKGNLKQNPDEVFDEVKDAIAKYVQKTEK